MDFFTSMRISATGLSAQRFRIHVIASNLANVNTTRTPEGGPYRRRDVVFAVQQAPGFEGLLRSALGRLPGAVRVIGVYEDPRDFKRVYQPGHPDADASGYLLLPNVNPIEELVNMISATRAYEANVTAINAAKEMALRSLEIGR